MRKIRLTNRLYRSTDSFAVLVGNKFGYFNEIHVFWNTFKILGGQKTPDAKNSSKYSEINIQITPSISGDFDFKHSNFVGIN